MTRYITTVWCSIMIWLSCECVAKTPKIWYRFPSHGNERREIQHEPPLQFVLPWPWCLGSVSIPPPWARPGRLIHYKSSKTFQPIAVDWLKLDWVWCQVVSAICRLEWSWTRVSDMLSAPVHCQLSISKRCSSLLRWFLLGFSFSFFLNFFVVFRYPHLLATNR